MANKKTGLVLLLALLICGVFSCKNDKEVVTIDLGYAYFPIKKGDFIVYSVDSFYYNDFTSKIDSFSFQIKEKIIEEYIDLSSQKAYKIERFYRKQASEPWVSKDVWNVKLTSGTAEKTEENITYVKLVFPLKNDLKWNGNRYNALGDQTYRIENLYAPAIINGKSFDSTITVIQLADSNLIQKKYAVEVYAKHTGLIYKRTIDVADRDSIINYTLPLTERINTGVDVSYRFIEQGSE